MYFFCTHILQLNIYKTKYVQITQKADHSQRRPKKVITDLGYLDVGTLETGAGRVVPGRLVHHLLDLIIGPVRVLPEYDAPASGCRWECHECITGGGLT